MGRIGISRYALRSLPAVLRTVPGISWLAGGSWALGSAGVRVHNHASRPSRLAAASWPPPPARGRVGRRCSAARCLSSVPRRRSRHRRSVLAKAAREASPLGDGQVQQPTRWDFRPPLLSPWKLRGRAHPRRGCQGHAVRGDGTATGVRGCARAARAERDRALLLRDAGLCRDPCHHTEAAARGTEHGTRDLFQPGSRAVEPLRSGSRLRADCLSGALRCDRRLWMRARTRLCAQQQSSAATWPLSKASLGEAILDRSCTGRSRIATPSDSY